jgi:hypothetical protein
MYGNFLHILFSHVVVPRMISFSFSIVHYDNRVHTLFSNGHNSNSMLSYIRAYYTDETISLILFQCFIASISDMLSYSCFYWRIYSSLHGIDNLFSVFQRKIAGKDNRKHGSILFWWASVWNECNWLIVFLFFSLLREWKRHRCLLFKVRERFPF